MNIPPTMNLPKTSLISADPAFTSQEKARLLTESDNKDLTFKLLYWDIASVGSTSRDLLIYGKAHHGAKFEFQSPTDQEWEEGKVYTAFSCLPMLKVVGPNNQEVDIAESMIIDIHLANQFGLLGDNTWESLTIQSFYSNIHYLRERTFSEVLVFPADRRLKVRDGFFKSVLKKFLDDHSFHLKQNGNNGHYVGNKVYRCEQVINDVDTGVLP